MKQVFNKLVRDKIPEKIEKNGEYALTRTLSDVEFNKALNDKLMEEACEVIKAKTNDEIKEELADLYEVMLAKIKLIDSNFSEIEEIAANKRNKRGAFDERIFLIQTVDQKYVDDNKGCLTCIKESCKVPYEEKNGYKKDGKPSGFYCVGYKSCYTKYRK